MSELNILLIEDNELERKAVFDLLAGWGHNVRACECLSDARNLISRKTFDLAFIDMRLPDGNGLDFLSELKDVHSELSMVIMTAFADVRTAVNAIRLGAYDYLPKPFENEQLKKILRNVGNKVDLNRRLSSLSRLTIGGYEDVWQFDSMIGTDALRRIFEKAQRVAGFSDTTVVIFGESGTGKGMLAKAIHRLSARADKPFIDINCSAIPSQLIESEIFGYEKGAFTDAKSSKPGLLEVADGGTVFLDEIGDMALNLQSKLLKVIEDKEFRRLGSGKTTTVNIRVLAATSRNLQAMVSEGKFRKDLYYRLSVIPITLPPLRDHKDSIGPLADYYLQASRKKMGREVKTFAPEALKAMIAYSWPGNIRELRNAIERGVILSTGGQITADVLGLADISAHAGKTDSTGAEPEIPPMSLAESEKRLIASVLKSVHGSKNKASEILKIHRTTLYKKIEEYGMK